MGKLFELINDHALEKLDEYYTECNVCGKTEVDLYPYQGQVTLENGEIDDDIYASCYECLQTKTMTHACDFFYEETIEKYVNSLKLPHNRTIELKSVLIEKYNRTPDIPIFMQRADQPLCCENITEFIGYPKNDNELYEASENLIYWEEGLKEKSEYYDFRTYGSPESLREIATFQCSHCGKKYFTFQFT
ncbi:CbrC family protein [Chryseobacterium tructae]|uniref:CbrC family protein n=1 Tax=Chryseobacterium tructae TaxID=1037380 RepID=A0ABV7XRY5_9FLAO|nr:CbrC family protein [Chryseobacterium tructae]MDN3691278.1 CbrC family protein [Chryseobacterium tructae]